MIRRHAMLFAAALALVASEPALAGGGKKKNNNNNDGGTPAPAPQSKDDEAVAYIVTLEGTKFRLSDDDSVGAIHKLQGYWKDGDVQSGTKSKIPGMLYWFAQRKSSTVAVAGINALGDLGKGPGTQKLVMLLDGLMMQKDPPADHVAAILASFKNAVDPDPRVVDAVMKVLDSDAVSAGKAADVFANYMGAPVDAKQKIFEALLLKFEAMIAAAAKPDNKAAVDKWNTLLPNAIGALNGISKQSFQDVPAARKWFGEKGHDAASWR